MAKKEFEVSISGKKLKTLLALKKTTKGKTDKIIAGYRSELANAVEDDHMHKGAFAYLSKLDNKEIEDAALEYRSLVSMLKKTGLMDKINAVKELPFDDDKGEKEPGASAKGGGNVVPLGEAAKRVVERAAAAPEK